MKTPLPPYTPKSVLQPHLALSKNVELYGPPPNGYRWRSAGEKTAKRDIVALGWSNEFVWDESYGSLGRTIREGSWPVATPVKTSAKRDSKGRFVSKAPPVKALPDLGENFRLHHGGYSESPCKNNVNSINSVLADPVGNRGRLYGCFAWSKSAQGHKYWEDRANGRTTLSPEDLDYLRAAKEFFEKRIAELTPKPPTVPELQAKILSLEGEVASLRRKLAGAKIVFPE